MSNRSAGVMTRRLCPASRRRNNRTIRLSIEIPGVFRLVELDIDGVDKVVLKRDKAVQ
jgi:hypothetical protein